MVYCECTRYSFHLRQGADLHFLFMACGRRELDQVVHPLFHNARFNEALKYLVELVEVW